jgi:hypothetical protein
MTAGDFESEQLGGPSDNEIAELPNKFVPRFAHRKPAESLRNRDQKFVTKSLSHCSCVAK